MQGRTVIGSPAHGAGEALPASLPSSPRGAPAQQRNHALACLTEVLTAVGRPEFYTALAAELCSLFGCGRYLAMCYSRHSKPVFLFNRSFPRAAGEIYLDSLYEHDPLYRTVLNGLPVRVLTLRSLEAEIRLSRYRAALLRHAHISDELAIMLPAPDGAAVAVCFNQESGCFDPDVVALAESIYPLLKQANRLHLERSSLAEALDRQLFSFRRDIESPRRLSRFELLEQFHELHRLSVQERKLLDLTIEGLANRSIARRLNLAFGTVKNYKRRLYRKLGVSTERALVRMVADYLAAGHAA
jgi:DNA-binding CsgD family transcriptional regulator